MSPPRLHAHLRLYTFTLCAGVASTASVALAVDVPALRTDASHAAVDALCARAAVAEPAEAAQTIRQLAATHAPEAARCLGSLLVEGLPDALADQAIAALGEIGVREAEATLVVFTHHRRAEARRRAYLALVRVHDAAAAALLVEGLHDTDPAVRAACAQALGEIGARQALPVLFRALGRGVTQAAPAIGTLGDAASVARFGTYLGKQPLEVMLAGYERYLLRADLDEATKLGIVATLEEVGGERVREFLQTLLRHPEHAPSPRLAGALRGSLVRLRPPPTAAPAKETKP